MNRARPLQLSTVILALVISGFAQDPATALLHTFENLSTAPQKDARQANFVAVDGHLAVVAAENDDTGGLNAGVVRVYDSDTGELLYVLTNPGPAPTRRFGISVAICGTRVVVGALLGQTNSLGTGVAYVYDLASANPTTPQLALPNSSVLALAEERIPAAISGTLVVVGDNGYDTGGVPDVGRASVYDVASANPSVPIFTLNNPSPSRFSSFGTSVAISGTRIIVSSIDQTVYAYDLAGGTPTLPVARLENPTPYSQTSKGPSVAISGTIAAIGNRTGRAYVYDLSNAAGTVPANQLNQPFGSSGFPVSISGSRIVVGTRGRAYVYDLTSSIPTNPAAVLENPIPAFAVEFGISVAVAGARIVVGAYDDNSLARNAGSAFTYDLSSAAPTEPTHKLTTPSPSSFEYFGYSLAISGTRLVVGAYFADTLEIGAGTACVYDLMSGTPTIPLVPLSKPSPSYFDYFGFSVGASDSRIVVGIPGDDTGANDTGSVYIYDADGPTPEVPITILNDPSPAPGDNFGTSVAVSGDLLVVGASGKNIGVPGRGTTYVYDLGNATPSVPIATLNNPSPANKDRFGRATAISGSLVVVGAVVSDTGALDAGSAYVFDLSSATPTAPVLTINNPSGAQLDYFGFAVAVSGTRLIVGAYQDDTGARNAGSAYVYDLASSTPSVPVVTLNNPNPNADDGFGISVTIFGTQIIVGAKGGITANGKTGIAYLYDLGSSTPAVPVGSLTSPLSKTGDQFGSAVAFDGHSIAIGSPGADGIAAGRGAATVFGPSNPDLDADGLLDIWEFAAYGSIHSAVPTDDTDHDGANDLIEMAFNRNPRRPDAAAGPKAVIEDGFLTITIPKRAGVAYAVETSGAVGGAGFSAATTTVLTNNASTLKVRDNVPISERGQRFLRVRVSASP